MGALWELSGSSSQLRVWHPNILITALDTFDLEADGDHDKFMNTLSEYKNLRQIPFWNTSFQTHMALKHLLDKSLFRYILPTRCNIVVCFQCRVHHIKLRHCKKTMVLNLRNSVVFDLWVSRIVLWCFPVSHRSAIYCCVGKCCWCWFLVPWPSCFPFLVSY